ncbi:G patch domain and KOW motifs-containing protein [Fasciola hepatica]|uniref:G patch domain and KOW motifs-containing protein n=1 Tax=Fasciola hepatica TaxID=6192 RepID=A0A4E0RAZ0_FASHE|nr:G patch domain and KOW motifs-containing protein [Fasciola hepatica]
MTDAPKLSFAFSKQKKSLKLASTVEDAISVQTKRESLREYVSCIEDNVIRSEKEPEKPLVIPLIHSRHGIRKKILEKVSAKVHPVDELTRQALIELKQESLDLSETTNAGTQKSNITIPLSSAITEDEKTDDVNYEEVPVEKFGLAILAGMGFNSDELKNKKEDVVGPLRPKGLGLGADPKAVQAVKNSAEQTTKEQLMWKVGAKCQVVLGKHRGKYGIVNGLDGDTGRVIIKFTLSKEVLPILQPTVRLVSEKEYSQYANCLNQDEVDRYKANEAEQRRHQYPDEREPLPHSSSRTHAGYQSNGLSNRPGERDRYSEPSKRSDISSHHSLNRRSWVRPNLRVKFLDKRYADGKYYKDKLTVLSVQDDGHCQCQTDSGRLLSDINPKYLQTVVPHTNNVKVMIVDGARAGEMARLVNQDSKRDEVDLKTRAGTMIQLTYDQVCSVSDQT